MALLPGHEKSYAMKYVFKKIFLLLFIPLIFIWFPFFVRAQTCDSSCPSGDATCLSKVISDCGSKISTLQSQANTLKNQIAQFDAQIKLTTLKIAQTQEQINMLGGRIVQLGESLDSLTLAFNSRAVETYKLSKFENNFYFVLSASDLGSAVSRFHYLQKIQEEDRNLLQRLQEAQTTYQGEKADQEALQKQLKTQQANLNAQKAAKANLLAITKNDEKKYQSLLSKAQAEIEAIQSIVAGLGKETEVGKVSEGGRIASVIPTSSACSSGGHLHFEVVKDGSHQNPAGFLSSKSVTWDNSPDGQFSFTGGWAWPINDPVRITQGYGMTYYAATLRYYSGKPHTGIDMVNAGDYTVKAVKPGTLYLGSIACGGGTLKYVHVKQDDGYETYYLHVNY